jgi:hypothetical protein
MVDNVRGRGVPAPSHRTTTYIRRIRMKVAIRVAKVAALLFMAVAVVALVSCDMNAKPGEKGDQGVRGQTGGDGPTGPRGPTGTTPAPTDDTTDDTTGAGELAPRPSGKIDPILINDGPGAVIGALPAPFSITDLFRGGFGTVGYALVYESFDHDGDSDTPNEDPTTTKPGAAGTSFFVGTLTVEGMLTVSKRTEGTTSDAETTGAYADGTTFWIKATDADRTVYAALHVRRNKAPAVGTAPTTVFYIGTQADATKKDDVLLMESAPDRRPETLLARAWGGDSNLIDCDQFGSCVIHIAPIDPPWFTDDGINPGASPPTGLDSLTYSPSATSGKVSVAPHKEAGKNGILVTGIGSSFKDAAFEQVEIKIVATDKKGLMSKEQTINVVVNGAPRATSTTWSPETLKKPLTDAGETVTIDVEPFFKDDEDDLLYRATSSAVAVATVNDMGTTSTLTVTAVYPGTATITVRATEQVGDGSADDSGLGQWVERTFLVTVKRP